MAQFIRLQATTSYCFVIVPSSLPQGMQHLLACVGLSWCNELFSSDEVRVPKEKHVNIQ